MARRQVGCLNATLPLGSKVQQRRTWAGGYDSCSCLMGVFVTVPKNCSHAFVHVYVLC